MTTPRNNNIRNATPADAEALSQLVNFAGEGMPLYLWSKMAEEGQSPWEVGEQRARRESGGFSLGNSHIIEVDGRVVAALVGYPIAADAEPANYDDMPAMFVPLQQLEDMVPGTWYVNVLAAFPEQRGKGYGKTLLELAERLATAAGCDGMSLIVADANTGARRLYERIGYSEIASRPMIKEDWDSPAQNWVLLRKPL